VCSRCAEIVEADAGTERCPACGATLAVRRRIVDRRAERTRSHASR
jgi:rRNA maturation endonuclease Nob1